MPNHPIILRRAAPEGLILREMAIVVASVPSVPSVSESPESPAPSGDLLDIVASDAACDRYGEVIDPSGWILTNYLRNPVIQNSHRTDSITDTIAVAETTEIRNGQLCQRWRFASDCNPVAKIAAGLYRGGFLRACSVGFISREWRDSDKLPYRTHTQAELVEVSACAIPANPNALCAAIPEAIRQGAVTEQDVKEMLLSLERLAAHAALVRTIADLRRSLSPSVPVRVGPCPSV